MDDSKLKTIVKAYLKLKEGAKPLQKTKDCPSETVLSDYIDSLLPENREKKVFEHVTGCLSCLETLVATRRAKELMGLSEFEDLPVRAIENARELPKRYGSFSPAESLKKNIWLIFAAVSFILSFTFDRYFIQFVAAAVVFGIKWIFDTGSTRTLIMVYNAWKNKDSQGMEEALDTFRRRSGLKNKTK